MYRMCRIAMITLCLTIMSGTLKMQAQQKYEWPDFITEFAEFQAGGDIGDPNNELLEDLYEIYCDKLNLNNLDETDLQRLPFLSDVQIREILVYISKNYPLLSTGELMAIESLSYRERKWLQLFCYAEKADTTGNSLKDYLLPYRHEVVTRLSVPLQTKVGYAQYPQSVLEKNPNKVYQGNALYHSLRYSGKLGKHIEVGFQTEKDAGEKMFDYISGSLMFKRWKFIDRLVVGNYRMSFGHGLAVNSSSSFGKIMTLSSLGSINKGLRRHSSMQESDYFTGAALSTSLPFLNIQISGFFSHRDIDATMLSDSSGVSSLKTDGLHRTLLERSKRGIVGKTDFGGNINYNSDRISVAATAIITHLSTPLHPKFDTPSTAYRKYNAQGTDFGTYSIAYSYRASGFSFSGETATSQSGGFATLNMIQHDWHGNKITALFRHYSPKYVSLNGKTFGENSRPQNESGFYAGYAMNISRRTRLETYFDYMYFPWMKYQVSNKSHGLEGMVQLSHSTDRIGEFSLRYRVKSKQHDWKHSIGDNSEMINTLIFNTVQSIRIQHNVTFSPTINLRSNVYAQLVYSAKDGSRNGFAVSEYLVWKPIKKYIPNLCLNLMYFHTDDYASRIYNYQPSPLYTFTSRSYYGEGLHTTLLLRQKLAERLSVIFQFSSTRYFDRSTIGSGLEEILHNHREDVQLQLIWKL